MFEILAEPGNETHNGRGKPFSIRFSTAEVQDSRFRLGTRRKHQLAKIAIFCQQYPIVLHRDVENFAIECTARGLRCCDDIMADFPQRPGYSDVAALVGQKPHACEPSAYPAVLASNVSVWAISSAANATAARMSSRVRCG